MKDLDLIINIPFPFVFLSFIFYLSLSIVFVLFEKVFAKYIMFIFNLNLFIYICFFVIELYGLKIVEKIEYYLLSYLIFYLIFFMIIFFLIIRKYFKIHLQSLKLIVLFNYFILASCFL